MSFTIVIPCFNEVGNIPEIVRLFSELMKDRNDVKIIIVNNGSTDNSYSVLQDLVDKNDFLEALHIKTNIGYGNGVVEGLRLAKTDFVGWMYGDLQSRPLDTMKAIDMMIAESFPKDLYIKGRRQGRSSLDRFITFGMSILESIIFGKLMYDINSSPSLVHKSFFESWKNPPDDYSLDLYSYYLSKIKKLRMKRFKIQYLPRVYGYTTWNYGLKAKLSLSLNFLKYSVRLKKALKEPND